MNCENLDFAEVFSLEDFKTIVEHKNARPKIEQLASNTNSLDNLPIEYKQWQEKLRELSNDLVIAPIKKFLLKMKAQGRFHIVENSEEVSTRFINAWNRIAKTDVNNVKEVDVNFVASRLGKLVYSSVYPISNIDIDKYSDLCRYITEGDFQWYEVDINDECSKTGKDLLLEFDGWNCMHGSFENGSFLLSEKIEKRPAIANTTVSFKTGNLIIADWIRIEEFTDIVDESENLNSMGSEFGREQKTKKYAEEFNFISVSVGNTCPTIFANQGKLVFGYIDEESGQHIQSKKKSKDTLREIGSVCTDYWAATIIEEENLVDIIASKMGQDKAKLLVADYLAKNNVRRVKVSPGQYHIYFHGNSYTFSESFQPESLDLSNVCEPYFVVSNEVIALKDTNANINSAPVKKYKPS